MENSLVYDIVNQIGKGQVSYYRRNDNGRYQSIEYVVIPLSVVKLSDNLTNLFVEALNKDIKECLDILDDDDRYLEHELIQDDIKFSKMIRNRLIHNKRDLAVCIVHEKDHNRIGHVIGKIEKTNINVSLVGVPGSVFDIIEDILKDADNLTISEYKDFIVTALKEANEAYKNCSFDYRWYVHSTTEVDVVAANLIKLVKKGSDNEDTNYIGECNKVAVEVLATLPKIHHLCNVAIGGYIGGTLLNLTRVVGTNDCEDNCVNSTDTKSLVAEVSVTESFRVQEPCKDGLYFMQRDSNDLIIKEILNNMLGPNELLSLNVPFGYDLSQSFKAKYI